MVTCLNEGITWGFVADVLLEAVLTLGDVFFDFFLVKSLIQDGHYKYSMCAIISILAPGITSVVALSMDGQKKKLKDVFWTRLSIILFYPFWICLLAWRTIQDRTKLALMLHLKSYEGLLEASFQFLFQLVVFLRLTPVGNMKRLGIFVRNGEFWLRLVSTVISLLAFSYGASRYHCLLDKTYNIGPVFRVMPYFLIHILFRSFTFSLLFIYAKGNVYALPFIFLISMFFVNMYFTRRTMNKNSPNHQIVNPRFSYTVGGIISTLTPALGTSYGHGASGRTVRAYYRKNTIVMNSAIFVAFFVLVIYLNFGVDERIQQRFPWLSCRQKNHTWLPSDYGIDKDTEMFVPIEQNFTFMGQPWEVQQKPQKNQYRESFRNQTDDCGPGEDEDQECIQYFLVAQNCKNEVGLEVIERFNKFIIPIVLLLGGLSWATLFCNCFLIYKNDVDDVDDYNY